MSSGYYLEVITSKGAKHVQYVNVKSGTIESIFADDYWLVPQPSKASLFAAHHIAYLDIIRQHLSSSMDLLNVRFVKADRYE